MVERVCELQRRLTRGCWVIVCAGVVTFGLGFGFAGGARASAALSGCGSYNPICPYGATQVYGGTDASSLDGPFAVASTPGGDVIVGDEANESVREFSSTGQLIEQLGTPGSYTQLAGVAVDPDTGEVWVASNCSLDGYSAQGSEITAVAGCSGSASSDGAPYFSPAAVAVGPNSDVYVLSTRGTPEILIFAQSGTFITSFSVATAFEDGINTGTIAVDGAGDVYVNPTGEAITEFNDSGGDLGTIPVGENVLGHAAGNGTAFGIAFANGNLYVEPTAGEIEEFGPAGGLYSAQWSGDFSDDANTGIGAAFTVDANGDIIAATTQHSIEELNASGTETGSWGALAVDDFVPDVAVADPTGDVFILDGANQRVIEYPAGGGAPTVFADLSADSGIIGAAIDPSGDLVVSTPDGLVSFNSTGQVTGTMSTPCLPVHFLGFDATGDSYLYGFGGSFQDSGGIFEYSPSGTLINSWALSANDVALAPDGDIYGAGFNESQSSMSTDIAEFSNTGQQLRVFSADEGWGPGQAESLAVDANGNLYEQADDDTIRMFNSAGAFVAVWPDASGNLSAAGGSVYVTGPANQVTRFSDFADPLPPAPGTSEDPDTPVPPSLTASELASLVSLVGSPKTAPAKVTASLACTGSDPCAGRAELEARVTVPRAQITRVEVLGTTKFDLTAGHRVTITLRLNRIARTTLQRRSLRATLAVTYTAGGVHRTLTHTLTLRRRA